MNWSPPFAAGRFDSPRFPMMPQTLICPNGHEFSRDAVAEMDEVRCPVCEAETPVRRGLWDVMGKVEPRADAAGESTEDAQPAEGSPKGLWAVMPRSEPTETEPMKSEPEPSAETSTADSPDESAPPKGLWALMKPRDVAVESNESEIESARVEDAHASTTAVVESNEDELATDAPEESLEDAASESPVTAEPPPASPRPAEPKREAVTSSGAKKALLLGLIALPASALSLLPELWLRIPANLLGFLALLVGIAAVGEVRRSRGRLKGRNLAIAGIACGVLSLLLGPFVFTQLGESWRRSFGRKRTFDNLQQIGDATNAYHAEKGEFPSGKVIRRHNWQTLLLPYLGEEQAELYQRINLTAEWDAEDNRPAMAEDVSVFFASGGDRKKVGGYGVTHFVALGGRMTVKDVGLVNVGVFDADQRVSRRDVTDGSEHTLIAGEIAFDPPAWGRPNKYRQIGKGLNRGRDGFGNSDRTGAMFLRADGSVRFFSNETDPEVLRKLSTRDGREKVDAGKW